MEAGACCAHCPTPKYFDIDKEGEGHHTGSCRGGCRRATSYCPLQSLRLSPAIYNTPSVHGLRSHTTLRGSSCCRGRGRFPRARRCA